MDAVAPEAEFGGCLALDASTFTFMNTMHIIRNCTSYIFQRNWVAIL